MLHKGMGDRKHISGKESKDGDGNEASLGNWEREVREGLGEKAMVIRQVGIDSYGLWG